MPANEVHAQIVRYGISGVALTLLYSAIYWTTAEPLHVHPLLANTLAFLITVAIGYVVHSRWSFRGHGSRDRPVLAYAKFFLVNIAGYAQNSFWVWLIVQQLDLSVPLSIVPMVFITPWVAFWLNRHWTFG